MSGGESAGRSAPVVIRTDASPQLGGGHASRSLVLAAQLRALGCQVLLAVRRSTPEFMRRVERMGVAILRLDPEARSEPDDAFATHESAPRDARLVVDHYHLAGEWQEAARRLGHIVIAIGPDPDRKQAADVVVVGSTRPHDSLRLTGAPALRHGLDFIVIDASWHRDASRPRPQGSGPLIIAFGASDVARATLPALEGTISSGRWPSIDVFIPEAHPDRGGLEELASTGGAGLVRIRLDHDGYQGAVLGASAAIGAGGISLWERIAAEVPAAVLPVATNQTHDCDFAAARGAIQIIDGGAGTVDWLKIARDLASIDAGEMSQRCRTLAHRLAGGPARVAHVVLTAERRPDE